MARIHPPSGARIFSSPTQRTRMTRTTCRFLMSAPFLLRVRPAPPSKIGRRMMMIARFWRYSTPAPLLSLIRCPRHQLTRAARCMTCHLLPRDPKDSRGNVRRPGQPMPDLQEILALRRRSRGRRNRHTSHGRDPPLLRKNFHPTHAPLSFSTLFLFLPR